MAQVGRADHGLPRGTEITGRSADRFQGRYLFHGGQVEGPHRPHQSVQHVRGDAGQFAVPRPARGGKLHIHVHESIDTEGLSEAEIADKVRAALLSKMQECQHPIPVAAAADAVEVDASAEVPIGKTGGAGKTHSAAAEASPEAEITDAVLRADKKDAASEKKEAAVEKNEPERKDEKQVV